MKFIVFEEGEVRLPRKGDLYLDEGEVYKACVNHHPSDCARAILRLLPDAKVSALAAKVERCDALEKEVADLRELVDEYKEITNTLEKIEEAVPRAMERRKQREAHLEAVEKERDDLRAKLKAADEESERAEAFLGKLADDLRETRRRFEECETELRAKLANAENEAATLRALLGEHVNSPGIPDGSSGQGILDDSKEGPVEVEFPPIEWPVLMTDRERFIVNQAGREFIDIVSKRCHDGRRAMRMAIENANKLADALAETIPALRRSEG